MSDADAVFVLTLLSFIAGSVITGGVLTWGRERGWW
jgi:hypothetical protein